MTSEVLLCLMLDACDQETIVELLSFAKRVSPATAAKAHPLHHARRRRMPTKEVGCQTTDDPVQRFPSLTSLNSLGFDQSSLFGDHFSSLLDVTTTDAG